MAMKVKHGTRIPTYTDLDHYQLGFNEDNNHLYIRDSENTIIDLNNPSIQGGTLYSLRLQFKPTDIYQYGTTTWPYVYTTGAISNGIIPVAVFNESPKNYFEIDIMNILKYRIGVVRGSANASVRYCNAIKFYPNHGISRLLKLDAFFGLITNFTSLDTTNHVNTTTLSTENFLRYNLNGTSYWNENDVHLLLFTNGDVLQIRTTTFLFGDKGGDTNISYNTLPSSFYIDVDISFIKNGNRNIVTPDNTIEIGL
jgi:hypothetical protein